MPITAISRGDVYWVNLDPTIGSESRKTRPAVIISNHIQNKVSKRVIVIPVTSQIDSIYSFETKVIVEGKAGKAMADQIRTIDKSRLKGYIGTISKIELKKLERAIKVALSLE